MGAGVASRAWARSVSIAMVAVRCGSGGLGGADRVVPGLAGGDQPDRPGWPEQGGQRRGPATDLLVGGLRSVGAVAGAAVGEPFADVHVRVEDAQDAGGQVGAGVGER